MSVQKAKNICVCDLPSVLLLPHAEGSHPSHPETMVTAIARQQKQKAIAAMVQGRMARASFHSGDTTEL